MEAGAQRDADNGANRDAGQRTGNRVLPSAESIKSIGGLVSVVVGILAITALAIATMAFIDSGKDASTLVPLSTAAFGVISALVGAYLGIKIGTDQSKSIVEGASTAADRLAAVHDQLDAERANDPQKP
jgi:VIT1/CCC1 family predicted Fe2+/Mn2+ transporter